MAAGENLIEDTDIFPTMLDLVDNVLAEMTRIDNPVDIGGLQAGLAPVIDKAGNGKTCSQLIVNLSNSFPTDSFPNNIASAIACGKFEMVYDIQVGVFRCAVTPKGNPPKLPSAEDLTNESREHLADMAAMRRAICGTLKDRLYIIRGFTPYGPQGNVVGGVWLVSVGPKRD